MKKDKKQIPVLTLINYLILIAAHIAFPVYCAFKYSRHIDSDMSSELLLGKVLRDEGGIIADNWYYSTELRVINTQLVYKLLFFFTDSYKTVKIASVVIFDLLLTGGAWLMCREMKLKKWFPFAAVCLMMPLSEDYYFFFSFGSYYIPHILFGILSLCVMLRILNSDKLKAGHLILSAAIAFIGSLEGIRLVVTCYLPLFGAAFLTTFVYCYKNGMDKLRKSPIFRVFIGSAATFFASGLGYVVNMKVLAPRHGFYVYNIRFVRFNHDRLREILTDFVEFYGYKEGNLPTKALVMNAFAIFLVAAVLYFTIRGIVHFSKVSPEYGFLSVFTAVSALIFLAIYTLTDMGYSKRYAFSFLVFTFPIIAAGITEADIGKLPASIRRITAIIVGGGVMVSSALTLYQLNSSDHTPGLREAAGFIRENGYTAGYATFWHSNILTELTNGQIEMYSWDIPKDEIDMTLTETPLTLTPWLQKVDHRTDPRTEDVILIFAEKELEKLPWADKLSDEHIVYSDLGYIIYEYADITELMPE